MPPPPSVEITSPTSSTTFDSSTAQITLAGTASASGGFSQLTARNDRDHIDRAAQGTTSWSVSNIPLFAGTNTITVTLTDGANQTAAAVLKVFFFTDTLTALVTPVRAIHFTDLRDAIDMVRARFNLANLVFSDGTPALQHVVLPSHLDDLRTAMVEVCAQAGCSVNFAPVTAGSVITAGPLNALRTLIRQLQ